MIIFEINKLVFSFCFGDVKIVEFIRSVLEFGKVIGMYMYKLYNL